MPNDTRQNEQNAERRLEIATRMLEGMLASEASGSGQLPPRTQGSDAEWRRACAKEALDWADALIEEAGK